jgi:hypothetical protein
MLCIVALSFCEVYSMLLHVVMYMAQTLDYE